MLLLLYQTVVYPPACLALPLQELCCLLPTLSLPSSAHLAPNSSLSHAAPAALLKLLQQGTVRPKADWPSVGSL
jgi:hypothetical protein